MPLIQSVLAQYPNPVFIETGTYKGDGVKLARSLGFKLIHTMDVNPGYAGNGAVAGAVCHCGDSPAVLTEILPGLAEPVTFWLDAHPLVMPMPLFSHEFPLLRELFVIKRMLKPGPHVILADDMRTFSAADLESLRWLAQTFWPAAKISRADNNIAKADVLVIDMR